MTSVFNVFIIFWDSCNVLGSTFFGLPHLKDNFLFLHADTLFREEILKDILNSSYSNVLSINKKRLVMKR